MCSKMESSTTTTVRIIYYFFVMLWNVPGTVTSESYPQETSIVKVLVNSTAIIKCDVSSIHTNDQVLLVVWYKNNLPIYSYDTRGTHTQQPSHWKDDDILESRATFREGGKPNELLINPVLEKDAGSFRCRVDFKITPTKNSHVELQVVVPPQPPKIFNERGEQVESRAGPYEEGGDLHLVCIVTGGAPPPTVTWLSNGVEQESIMSDFAYPSTFNSKLVVRNLSRIHQHAVYTCQASNFYRKSVGTNVTIELYLRPLDVTISFNTQVLSSDRSYEISCEAVGSRPPAKITWWLGAQELKDHRTKVSADGNITSSLLNFQPTRQDNGKVLVCRATNELVKRGIKETSMKLNIYFVPTIQLELGSNLNPDDIEEGDDVYFECKVHANPNAYKVVWKHNGQTVQHNSKAGVIMSVGDLALQGVTRHQAGNYTCIASNVEGDGESNTVELRVMYKPICRPDQKRVYGVARNEAAEVLCEVDAYPPPESFKWSFNNTAETFDVPQERYRLHNEKASKLTYTPEKEHDFGTIMCRADNVVGQQKEPCVFHLIAAGKPDMPYNCTLVNQTSESLEVDCNEGFDGGQRQWFIMEIFDQITEVLQANVSSKFPIFTVGGLDAGKMLKINIYAANSKGRSETATIEGYTLKAAEKQTGTHTSTQLELTPILSIGIFIGIITALTCITIAVIVALKMRSTHQQNRHGAGGVTGKTRPGNLPIKEKISVPLSQSEELYDEKNPDVIPSNEDPEYKMKSGTATPSSTLQNSINCNDHELLSKTLGDENRKAAYLTAPSGEVHYAELSLPMPRAGSKDQINHVKKPPPPAYTYYEEPTIYAQIDHSKAYQPPSSSSSQTRVGAGLANSMPHSSSHHQLPAPSLNHHHQHQQLHSPHTVYNMAATQTLLPPGAAVRTVVVGTAVGSQFPSVIAATSPLSASDQHVLHHQTMLLQHNPMVGVVGGGSGGGGGGCGGSNSAVATQAMYPAPTPPPPSHPNNISNNKQYLREIVTVRTPVAFSQQESCV